MYIVKISEVWDIVITDGTTRRYAVQKHQNIARGITAIPTIFFVIT